MHDEGGIRVLERDEILQDAEIDLSRFFAKRFSVRQFSSEDVAPSLIRRAVAMAQKTPSVCNRQTTRVHLYTLSGRQGSRPRSPER